MERSLFPYFETPAPDRRPDPHLTDRQREVLELLCEGLPNKLISRRLQISAATVKVHVSAVYRALGVQSRLQAVLAARNLGLVTFGVSARAGSAQLAGAY